MDRVRAVFLPGSRDIMYDKRHKDRSDSGNTASGGANVYIDVFKVTEEKEEIFRCQF